MVLFETQYLTTDSSSVRKSRSKYKTPKKTLTLKLNKKSLNCLARLLEASSIHNFLEQLGREMGRRCHFGQSGQQLLDRLQTRLIKYSSCANCDYYECGTVIPGLLAISKYQITLILCDKCSSNIEKESRANTVIKGVRPSARQRKEFI